MKDNLQDISLERLELKFPKVFKPIKENYCTTDTFGNLKFLEFQKNTILKNKISEKVLNRQNLKETWEIKINSLLLKHFEFKRRQASFGFYPSYGIIIELPKTSSWNFEAHIQLSLIGDFYSIRIAHINPNMVFRYNHGFSDIGYGIEELIVSPSSGFLGETFNKLIDVILEFDNDALFFPYCLELFKLKGLSTYEELEETPLGMAFFHPTLPVNYYNPKEIIGNIEYGLGEIIS
jgi:hypothetical protein